MNAADRLIGKAHDYEHLAAATAFTVAAIIMREVAAALEDEWEAA
jgi:hypothetical protein